jgi:hypothetical protein
MLPNSKKTFKVRQQVSLFLAIQIRFSPELHPSFGSMFIKTTFCLSSMVSALPSPGIIRNQNHPSHRPLQPSQRSPPVYSEPTPHPFLFLSILLADSTITYHSYSITTYLPKTCTLATVYVRMYILSTERQKTAWKGHETA